MAPTILVTEEDATALLGILGETLKVPAGIDFEIANEHRAMMSGTVGTGTTENARRVDGMKTDWRFAI